MKISIIGSGYVGLTTGICLAELGHEIIFMDNNKEKIEILKKLEIPIYEPGLKELLIKNKDRINFVFDIKEATSDVIFLCLPTPTNNNGEADINSIIQVSLELAKIIKDKKTIVVKSTVPVGTCEKIKQIFGNRAYVVSNPEFLREGHAVYDFMNPDRIVIGVDNDEAKRIMKNVYEKLKEKIIFMDIKSAEMTKYAANAFLALKISFINEIANLCEKTGANIKNVKIGIGSDNRIGMSFLNAGIGWGGSCFPKDTLALIKIGEKNGVEMKIVKAARDVNLKQREIFARKILKYYKGKTKLAVLGLSFKPNTDDMRDAPSINIINFLLFKGFEIKAYDPKALENAKQVFDNKIYYASDVYDALKDSEGLVLLTEWCEFKNIDWKKARKLMKRKVVFDGRNFLKPPKDFEYFGIGLPKE
ncbi:MAG: UDP-glucose/GDP-mannose dehydrogenase family protein [Candidatus Aenigmatarchaeota archaeon]|nr:UDP-glucose/GDP-mannose dehydrogenase family protein [Candidatus Aenigmarchaeota archaeon]